MEALTPSPYPITPQTSHMRTSSQSQQARVNPTTTQQAATRIMQQADSQPLLLSAPGSQESFASTGSSTNATRLASSSSNVSQLTNYTDLTSPKSNAAGAFEGHHVAPARPEFARRRTPEEGAFGGSPMSVTSPVTNGAKRTASGHVKNAPSLPNTPLTTQFPPGQRSRTDSISSTGSRAGELAASLKTRLGYAMAKVQNGWEHKDINEVEKLAASRVQHGGNRHSVSHVNGNGSGRPMSSGLSNGAARLSMFEPYPARTRSPPLPNKRHSGHYYSSSQPAPRLQPAPDIRPTTSQRHQHYPASQPTTNGSKYDSTVMSPPRTPVQPNHIRRQGPATNIRTDLQTADAERDAVEALFQLGSPHLSQEERRRASQASSAQASPLRAEFATPRRVTFARGESDHSVARSTGSDWI